MDGLVSVGVLSQLDYIQVGALSQPNTFKVGVLSQLCLNQLGVLSQLDYIQVGALSQPNTFKVGVLSQLFDIRELEYYPNCSTYLSWSTIPTVCQNCSIISTTPSR